MSTKKLTKDNDFPKRLRALIIDKLKISQANFCKKHGITSGYLSMILSGKRGPSADLIAEIHLNYSEHLTWLLTGNDETKDPLPSKQSVISEHQDMIKNFKNPERAKDINKKLLEIEELSEKIYDRVDIYIEAARDSARAEKGLKKTRKTRRGPREFQPSTQKNRANGN
ncbi:MAG: helix-turn-helix domain-containing protein [Desulfobacterales bacterium]|nr:helix-turn-helix domain-containing protein [Desulfobacterales bacterium]